MQATQNKEVTSTEVTLCVAFELYRPNWTPALQDGKRDRPAITSVSAEEANARLEQALAVIETTRCNWGLSADTPVAVVYELGEDGYWIARALQQRGIDLRVEAALHGNSMKEEVRCILRKTLKHFPAPKGLGSRIAQRFGAMGGVQLELPARDEPPRAPDF